MDQRKLIQHGVSSLTLALPIKWLKERGLSKGDSLNVSEEGNKLVISTQESLKIGSISIEISDLDRTSIILYIQSLYRFGYNEVEVKFSNQMVPHYRKSENVIVSSVIHYITNRLIGFEIIEQTRNRVLIKYLSKESEEDFMVILRRVFILLNETADNLLEGIKNKDKNFISTVEENHDNITKFVSYALRLLNKYGHSDIKKTSFYYHIIASLDKIVDILKYNARDLQKGSIAFNKETITIIDRINQSLKLYYDLFYNFDLKKVNSLGKNRDSIKNSISAAMKKISTEELIILNNMKQVLEILLDLTEFRMGLEY